MKYDKKFSLAIVKYINKKILLNQINDLYNINIVINLLDNIDHFIILYKSSLTKRLLNKNELDINNEKYVAKILCLNNNLIDISRINKMLEDYSKSIIFTRQFNEIYSQNDYINIITYDIWSINENNIVINNKELKKIIESKEKLLKSYYNNIESSKNLKMVDELCTLEIDFNNINLICTYKQAEFLYYFNDNKDYYIENKIFDEDLIKTFLETKIVKRKNNMIFINDKFQYKSSILDLSKFQKKRKNVLKKMDSKEKNKLIIENNQVIDCLIVKIVKKEKNIKAKELLDLLNTSYNNNSYNNNSYNNNSCNNISNNVFNNRLDYLEKNKFIKINNVDNIEYNP